VVSTDENDVEDDSENEDDPLLVIDESRKSSFIWAIAGVNGNLGTTWGVRTGSNWRSRTDHCDWRSD
jgi:hypothetical protein